MSDPVIRFDGVGKVFRRSLSAAFLYAAQDTGRKLLRLKPRETLRKDEFWALREVSFAAERGECIGIIGPNGAGKSTLLKLANRAYRPDRGRVVSHGRVKSLIRLGTGLQPLLTGRENLYVKCAELGFGKTETDALLDGIVAFAGLEKSLDQPVKHYSDGMYARLEFAVATAAPMDILLIDEVLAVGDIAFQMRALERLDQLKRVGTTLLFVSHSEMQVRQIADRCLLLFDGEALAIGETDALFRRYYEAVGFANRALKPLGVAAECPADFSGMAAIQALEMTGEAAVRGSARTREPLALLLRYAATKPVPDPVLVLQFWNPAGLPMGFLEVDLGGGAVLVPEGGTLRVRFPWFGLPAGIYRVAGGFRSGERWLGYRSNLLRLCVVETYPEKYRGLFALQGEVSVEV